MRTRKRGKHRREPEWIIRRGRYNRWGVVSAKTGTEPIYGLWVRKSQAKMIANNLNSKGAK